MKQNSSIFASPSSQKDLEFDKNKVLLGEGAGSPNQDPNYNNKNKSNGKYFIINLTSSLPQTFIGMSHYFIWEYGGKKVQLVILDEEELEIIKESMI